MNKYILLFIVGIIGIIATPSITNARIWKSGSYVPTLTIPSSTANPCLLINSALLVVDCSSNLVGIGTTTPTGKLEISGKQAGETDLLRLSGTSNPRFRLMTNSTDSNSRNYSISTNQALLGDFIIRQSGTNVSDPINGNSMLNFRRTGDIILGEYSGATVTIGTTSAPTSPGVFVVERQGGLGRLTIGVDNFLGSATRDVRFEASGTDDAVKTGGFVFRTDTGASTNDSMVILGAGNVGIGTTTPNYNLQINTVSNGVAPSSSGIPTGGFGMTSLSGSSVTMSMGVAGTSLGYPLGLSWIQSQAITAAGTAFVLSLNPIGGNVGIGTTTPTTQLQVTNASANATSTLTIGKVGQNKGTCLEFFTANGTAIYGYIPTGGTALVFSATSCK